MLAPEGINGTICYPFSSEDDDEDKVFNYLKGHALFGGPELRTRLSVWKDYCDDFQSSASDEDVNPIERKIHDLKQPQQAFQRLKIKIKAEIVTMGLGRPLCRNGECVGGSDDVLDCKNGASSQQPLQSTASSRHQQNQLCNPQILKGTYLTPSQWDEAIRDEEILVIDTRNTYEVEIGTFQGALDPKTKHFAEFPGYLERLAGEYDFDGSCEGDGKVLEDKADAQPGGGKQCGKKKPPKAIAMVRFIVM